MPFHCINKDPGFCDEEGHPAATNCSEAQSTPGQWCVARASDVAPGAASGGLRPQRPDVASDVLDGVS